MSLDIFLVRHGESVANIDPTVYQKTADHAVELSEKGLIQARDAGAFLYQKLADKAMDTGGHGHTRIWTSPYKRARQTAEQIKAQVGGPLLWDYREDILLCEQQFGLFDGIPDEELPDRFPAEHHHYDKCEKHEGRFWARMPLGESRFDVALRTRMFFGTLMRDFDQGVDTHIIVCHGVTLRAFVMGWMHHPVEWFEQERNPKNCSVRHLIGTGEKKQDLGYVFQTSMT